MSRAVLSIVFFVVVIQQSILLKANFERLGEGESALMSEDATSSDSEPQNGLLSESGSETEATSSGCDSQNEQVIRKRYHVFSLSTLLSFIFRFEQPEDFSWYVALL